MRRWSKHRWVAEYHDDFVRRHRAELLSNKVDVDALEIDIVDGNRRLRQVTAIGDSKRTVR